MHLSARIVSIGPLTKIPTPSMQLVWPNDAYLPSYVDALEITTDVANVASQRVITANGGQLVERFFKPAVYGGAESFRFRIYFTDDTAATN